MGKIESQPISIKKHADLIDVSTPHENKDIAEKTLTANNLAPSIFKVRVPMVFLERDTGNLPADSTGNKFWGEVKFKIAIKDLIAGKLKVKLLSSHGSILTDVYIYDHEFGDRVAYIRGNTGEYVSDFALAVINENDTLQLGIDVYQAGGSGTYTKVYVAYAELTYESEGRD